jgi:ATP-dependent exoDNAse (exonuclease V) beta subunit
MHFDSSALTDEEAGSQPVSASAPVSIPTFQRAIAAFDPGAGRSVLAPPRSLDAGSDEVIDAPEYTWVGPRARAEGTVVHAVLEAIARSGDWSLVGSTALHARVTRQLMQLGVSTPDAATLTTQIMLRLGTLQQQPRAQWLLSTGHRDAHCELRLTGVVQGRLRNIVIDRSFIDEAGQRWVIDYKTSTHTGGGLDEFLSRELDRYRPQLEAYRELASRLGPEPVRAALYFPWLGEWRELDAHSPASEKG